MDFNMDFSSNMITGLVNLGGIFIIFAIIYVLSMTALLVFEVIAAWKMFEKAGKPGWASIVPVYNVVVLLDIIGYKWYYIFLFLLGGIPFIGQVALILFLISFSIKLAKSYNQSTGFGIGLLLISMVFVPIIAFSKDIKYVGKSVNGDIDFKDLF